MEAMNYVGMQKRKLSSREIVRALKASRNIQILFAAVNHLDEGLNLETVLK
jgi:hypothetical protein